jgi:hypothetical protein
MVLSVFVVVPVTLMQTVPKVKFALITQSEQMD